MLQHTELDCKYHVIFIYVTIREALQGLLPWSFLFQAWPNHSDRFTICNNSIVCGVFE